MYFSYSNIKFKKHGQENWLIMSGEITNKCGRDFHAVVFRIIVFIKTMPIANEAVIINGFSAGQTKTFEKQIGELEYKMIREITRYEIYAESGY